MNKRETFLNLGVNLLTNYTYDKMVNKYEFERDEAECVLGEATRLADKALGDKSTPEIKEVVRRVDRRVERRVDRRVDR
ncbi:hypothetical protein B4087_5806 [Bacillus cereus]|uniref:Uncharacterized protein n=1 Tax=Bacillus thuringiensis TaxID=1428 RepID=A0A4Y8TBH3_BACTU|nr:MULTISPECIES: hypothetical protein [Bacillus]KLA15777.1 hypothetical protein B4087_5806 [Bacillus cereus]KMP68351.1 hypothetical protein TU57_08460 [Bacillus cereus]MCG3786608.1 hypothetical protein [Bacillus sp. UTDS19-33BHI26]TFF47924.1 hypothetical protein EQ803_06535 [Bacillus thuringiensis]